MGENHHQDTPRLAIADVNRTSPQTSSHEQTRSRSSLHDSVPPNRPTTDTIDTALDLYFTHCHRQPLWLFQDRGSLTADNCHEEILFPILALASCLIATDSPLTQRLDFKECCDLARSVIMARIMNGTVAFSTLQSLCLLALANFVGKSVL